MGEHNDTEREFERVFGMVQKNSDQDASKSESMYGATQKLPGDSDVLGIRTDSDRFIFKDPIPERLPVVPPASAEASSDGSSPKKGSNAPPPDAMTIALNVNVFANIPKPGEPGDLSNVAWSEATQLFAMKPETPVANGPTFTSPRNKQGQGGDILRRPLQSASGVGEPVPVAKFTRVMHVQDSVSLPQSSISPQPTNVSAAVAPPAETSSDPTPAASHVEAGPSDFTRIVRGSELRSLQEKFAASENQAAPVQGTWSAQQNAPLSLAAGIATQIWSASPSQTQRRVMRNSQTWPTQPTPVPPTTREPERPVAEPSKFSQYLPLILLLNLLFLLAILLIVLFAIKK